MADKKLNIEVEVKKAIKAKKIHFGEKQTRASIVAGEAKLVILPQNCFYRDEMQNLASLSNIEIFNFEGDSYKLGNVCERQFAINSLVIIK